MQTGDIKLGQTFKYEGKLYQALEWQLHSQPRLAAVIKARIKNLETGSVLDKTFKTNENVEQVLIERKEMQYLYHDGEIYYFMDNETYEQLPLHKNSVGDALKFIVENMNVTITSCEDKILAVEPPLFVELKIVDCDPAIQGDTTKTAMKNAVLETGINIKVPLFVGNGETVRIDTRTGTYLERVY